MAILQGCPGIKVTIVSNGTTLEEYPDEEGQFNDKKFSSPPDDRISLAYVECTSDAEFGIKWEVTPEYDPNGEHTHISFWAYVDGKGIGGTTSAVPYGYTYTNLFESALSVVSDTELSKQKLKFCSITKVDDADSARVMSDAKVADGLGEIIVYVHRTNQGAEMETFKKSSKDAESPVTEIAEKALKGRAISHGVGLGPETRMSVPRHAKTLYPDGNKNPLGVFRFKYRSRDALQQEMIIPRSPSPDVVIRPLNSRRPNNGNANLSKEERLTKLKREIEEIKSENQDENPRSRKHGLDSSEIQPSGRAYKTSRYSNGSVVVDLTDD